MTKPLPSRIIYRAANGEGVSERDPSEEVTLALTKSGDHGLPHVVMLSEVSWLDVPRLAERHGWYAAQFGERGSPEAGVALASRMPIYAAHLFEGSAATREGGGFRMRPILVASTYGRATASIHAPAERAPEARERYLDYLRPLRAGIIGGDWNLSPYEVRRRYPQRVYAGVGVLGVLAKPRFRDGFGTPSPVNVHSDHAAVDVPIR